MICKWDYTNLTLKYDIVFSPSQTFRRSGEEVNCTVYLIVPIF